MSNRRAFIKQAGAGMLSATYLSVAHAKSDSAKNTKIPDTLRLAIVGTGQVSHKFLKEAAANSDVKFVATCARTLPSAKERAAEYGIGAWFDDYNAMYDAVKPDGVVIATPSSVHAAPAIAALERRIPVLCEKPMATSFEDCQAMVGAAARTGTLFLNLPFDASAAVRTAMNYLNQSAIGVFTGAEGQLLIGGHPRANWYYDRTVAGGAALDSLVYPVSRLISLLGPARKVTGFLNTLIPHRIVDGKTVNSTIDDNVSLVLEWAGGQQAVLRTLWGVSLGRADVVVYGRHGTLWNTIFGDDVVIHSPQRPIEEGEPISWKDQTNCYRIPVKSDTSEYQGPVRHFADCIKGLAQPTCSGRQQLHVHEILFKGYEAARTGRSQDLQTDFKPWHKLEPGFLDARSRPI